MISEIISEIIFSELPSRLSYFARNANSTAFLRRLMHFCLISHCPAFYRNLPHYSIIIGNIGDMMQGDVNTLTADTVKVLAPKTSPAF